MIHGHDSESFLEAKFFACIVSFNPHSNPVWWVPLLCSSYTEEETEVQSW